jgi:hypothetical protein
VVLGGAAGMVAQKCRLFFLSMVDLRTIQLLLGHRSIDTTTRSLHITRQHLAKVHRPFDLLCFGDTPCPQTE